MHHTLRERGRQRGVLHGWRWSAVDVFEWTAAGFNWADSWLLAARGEESVSNRTGALRFAARGECSVGEGWRWSAVDVFEWTAAGFNWADSWLLAARGEESVSNRTGALRFAARGECSVGEGWRWSAVDVFEWTAAGFNWADSWLLAARGEESVSNRTGALRFAARGECSVGEGWRWSAVDVFEWTAAGFNWADSWLLAARGEESVSNRTGALRFAARGECSVGEGWRWSAVGVFEWTAAGFNWADSWLLAARGEESVCNRTGALRFAARGECSVG